jgi:hypothetical protein
MTSASEKFADGAADGADEDSIAADEPIEWPSIDDEDPSSLQPATRATPTAAAAKAVAIRVLRTAVLLG